MSRAYAGAVRCVPSGSGSTSVSAPDALLDSGRTFVVATAADNSVTRGLEPTALFRDVVAARAASETAEWADDGSEAIPPAAVENAISVLFGLPSTLPPPAITPEITGEIAFEWYRDRHRVVVVTVDGSRIRWAAMLGADSPISGSEPFTRTLPPAALQAIQAVIA